MRESRYHGIGTGVVFITVGLLFLLDRQGTISFHHSFPVIIIVLGLAALLFPDDRGNRAAIIAGRRACGSDRPLGGLWMILVGVLLLLQMNNIWSFQQSWPLFIVAAGLGVIFKSFRRRPIGPAGFGESSDPARPVDSGDFFRKDGGRD